ncbi:unnamed protein product [Victoria cruziana]
MASMASRFFAAILLFSTLEGVLPVAGGSDDVAFDVNYSISWGADHVVKLDQGREVRLSLDNRSGSGFQSKLEYGSGFFHVNMKTPSSGDTAGTVTAFYLTSHTNAHDELDFEFLGNVEGKPGALQTNVYVDGNGGREERVELWFDPSRDFHSYKILWNRHLIVFFVDGIPIRVFLNKSNRGVAYPSRPMQVTASLWNGEWATEGGKVGIDWRYAPFIASFRGFSVDGCAAEGSRTQRCHLPKYWWNGGAYAGLSATQKAAYQRVRKKYLTYDYCSDRDRYPVLPPECPQLSS